MMELILFGMLVVVKAANPIVISASKVDVGGGKMGYMYQTSSIVIVMTLSMCVAHLGLCYAKGQMSSVWQKKPLVIFGLNGVFYALGDYLEMNSLGALPPAAYQTLQQSRIIVTALLVMCAKGVYQTRMQWVILTILFLSMAMYMIIDSSGKKSSSDASSAELFVGILMSSAKVFTSCFVAVNTDKYTKMFKSDPTYVCIARTFVGRSIGIILISFTQDVWSKGFFSGWDGMTVVATGSFIVKALSSLYFVALLDSILKNIAESFSVLVIYFYGVLAPWVSKQFELTTCLSVFVVVAACSAYIDSKDVIAKAANYDQNLEEKP